MTNSGENNCLACGALLAPTMTNCPHCGVARGATAAPTQPPVQQSAVPPPPKEAKGLNQDIFGPNAIWVALAFYLAGPAMKYFGFVGDVVVIFLDLFGYVINIGWTARVASEKGYPALGLFGVLPIVGPIIVACVRAKPGFEMKPLKLAQGKGDIIMGVPYDPTGSSEKAKFDLD